jgi:hypothetical protein
MTSQDDVALPAAAGAADDGAVLPAGAPLDGWVTGLPVGACTTGVLTGDELHAAMSRAAGTARIVSLIRAVIYFS